MNAPTNTIFESISKAGMVAPTTLNGLPGMSSSEIAEITGKKHLHVLRDIRKMLDALKINPDLDTSSRCVETTFPDSYGRLQPLTILDKELTFTLLSRYSFELSNLIVKRWMVLEGSGFERVSVQAAVIHLIEREKDIRREALKKLKRSVPKKLTAEQKDRQKYQRQAATQVRKDRLRGREMS
jgi:phage regulator Rha-like protein